MTRITQLRHRPDRAAATREAFGWHASNVNAWDVDMDTGGEFSVTISRDHLTEDDRRWHVSVAGVEREPTWGELVEIVHRVRPGVPFALALPPRDWWLNLHQHCLHVLEVTDPVLLELWRFEGSLARTVPT